NSTAYGRQRRGFWGPRASKRRGNSDLAAITSGRKRSGFEQQRSDGTGQDLPETVHAASLISNNFQDLGVPPILGRGLWPSDAVDGQEPRPVAVLSHRFWRRHYLSNPDVVGRTLHLDHRNYEIVGVAAPRFTWY